MLAQSSSRFARVDLDGSLLWRQICILEADADRWVFCFERPENSVATPHFPVDGRHFLLGTGRESHFRTTVENGTDAGPALPPYRRLFAAYAAMDELYGDQVHYTATESEVDRDAVQRAATAAARGSPGTRGLSLVGSLLVTCRVLFA